MADDDLTPEQMVPRDISDSEMASDLDAPIASKAYAERVQQGSKLSEFFGRISKYAKHGWGDDPVGLDPGGDVEKWLHKSGMWADPEKGNITPLRAFNETAMRPTLNMLDLLRKTVLSAVGATGATFGQAADAMLGTVVETAGPDKAAKDFAGMIEVMPQLAPFNTVGPLTRASRAKGLSGTMDEMVGTGWATKRTIDDAATAVTEGQRIDNVATPQLERLYQEKGVHPAEAAQDAIHDPTVRQSLLSKGGDLPDEYTGANPAKPYIPDPPGGSEPPGTAVSRGVEQDSAPGGGGGKPPSGPPDGGPPAPRGPDDGPKGTPEPPDGSSAKWFEDRISVGEQGPGSPIDTARWYENMVDGLVPLDTRFKDAGLATFASPRALASLHSGHGAMSQYMLRKGTFEFHTLKTNGDSFETIIGRIPKGELKDFRTFITAARSAELAKRGIEPFEGFNAAGGMAKAAEVVARGEAKYGKAFKELVEYQNRVTAYLRDSGMLSRRGYEAMLKMNKYYVPWHQVMDPADAGWQLGGGTLNPKQTVYKIEKGQADRIIDPLESIVKNTMLAVSMAQRNTIGQSIARALRDIEITGELKRVPGTALAKGGPEVGTALKVAETRVGQARPVKGAARQDLIEWLDSQGLRWEGIDDGIQSEKGAFLNLRMQLERELSQLIRQKEGPGEIVFFEDGVRTVLEVGEDIARAYTQLDAPTAGVVVKALGVLASGLRKGALWNPRFWANHTIRDITAAAITYKGAGTLTYVDTLRGLYHGVLGRLAQSDAFDGWIKAGGGHSTLAAMTRPGLQDEIAKLTRQTGLITRAQNIVNDPSASWLNKGGRLIGTPFKSISKYTLHPIQVTTEIIMEANKLGAYMRRMKELEALPEGVAPGSPRLLPDGVQGFMRAIPDARDLPSIMEANAHLPAPLRRQLQLRPGVSWEEAEKAWRGVRGDRIIDADFADVHLKASPEKMRALDAALVGRDTSLDTARIGAKMRAWNMITAFLNTRIQEPDYVLRSMKANAGRTAAILFTAVTLPSVALWLVNRDDSRYKNLPQFQKDNYWIITTDEWTPTNSRPMEHENEGIDDTDQFRLIDGQWHRNTGTIYRVPKPFSLGVLFGSGAERMLEAFAKDNPEAFKGFADALLQSFVGDLHATGLVPVMEQMTGKRMFGGQNLIPGPMENLLPEYQYTIYTTETAKAVASFFSELPGLRDIGLTSKDPVSGGAARALTTPILIENYVKGWTGSLGTMTLQALDFGLRKAGVVFDPVNPPLKTLADNPFVAGFVMRWPTASVQSMQDFFDMAVKDQRYLKTWEAKAKEGDADAMARIQAAGGDQIFAPVDDIRKVITEGHTAIRMIYKNPDMKPEEKRQLIDELYHGMVAASQQGRFVLKTIRKALETKPEEPQWPPQ